MEGTETKEGRPILSKGQIQAVILYSLIGFVFFGYIFYEKYKLKRFGLVTRAYAYDLAHIRGATLAFRFNVNGHQYTGVVNTTSSLSAAEGDSLTIIYDPDDPENNSAPACDVLDKYKDVQ